jgi:hypothetical protein
MDIGVVDGRVDHSSTLSVGSSVRIIGTIAGGSLSFVGERSGVVCCAIVGNAVTLFLLMNRRMCQVMPYLDLDCAWILARPWMALLHYQIWAESLLVSSSAVRLGSCPFRLERGSSIAIFGHDICLFHRPCSGIDQPWPYWRKYRRPRRPSRIGKVVQYGGFRAFAQIASSPLNGGVQQPRYMKRRLERYRSMSRDLIRTFDWQQDAMLH